VTTVINIKLLLTWFYRNKDFLSAQLIGSKFIRNYIYILAFFLYYGILNLFYFWYCEVLYFVRTKALCITDNPYLSDDEWLMFTTSSDGNLKAWTMSKTDVRIIHKVIV